MDAFTQPTVTVLANGLYQLTELYRYDEFLIPTGFTWDGASVPRLLWTPSGVRPGGRFLGPSLIHDALYRYGGLVPRAWRGGAIRWTRKEADVVFRVMMKQAGVKWTICRRAYWAVRLFGWLSWKD